MIVVNQNSIAGRSSDPVGLISLSERWAVQRPASKVQIVMSVLSSKFGQRGFKGNAGEVALYNKLKTLYEVSDYRNDYSMQSQGIDFGIKLPSWQREFTLDVKSNLYVQPGWFAFKIELQKANKAGWLFTSKSDRIVHVSTYTNQYMYYDLNEMRYYITKKLLEGNHSFDISKIDGDTLLKFTISNDTPNDIPVTKLFSL